MKKNKGLQRRWLRNTLSIVLALVLLCVTALSVTVAAYYYSNMKAGMVSKARTSTKFFETYVGQSYNEYFRSCAKFTKNFDAKDVMELQFIDMNHRIVASSYMNLASAVAVTSDISQAIETKTISTFTGENPDTGERIMAVSSPLIYSNGEVIGVLRYVTSLQKVDRQIVIFSLTVAFVGLLLLLIVYISGRYYLKSILVPVSEITETAKRISAGGYGVQIQRKFDDEIGELADTINDMSNKISQSEKMQSEFMSSVSHELRTPLTAISGWSETLLSVGGSVDSAEAKRGLNIIVREARRLTGMVEELLEFSRISDGRFTLTGESLDLKAELEDAVYTYREFFRRDGIQLHYFDCPEESIPVSGDPERLRQVFCNLLDNAAKHGGAGKRIDVTVRVEEAAARISIRDYGAGIPEEELPFVKNKFYKGSSKARGSGIGLAVCDEIVERHGGSLTLSNAEEGGCVADIWLPIGT